MVSQSTFCASVSLFHNQLSVLVCHYVPTKECYFSFNGYYKYKSADKPYSYYFDNNIQVSLRNNIIIRIFIDLRSCLKSVAKSHFQYYFDKL